MKKETRRGGALRRLTSGALAALTSLALACVLVPATAVTALAAEAEDAGAAALEALSSSSVTASGTCGTCTWTLYGDGELVIAPTSGSTGTLESMTSIDDVPWYSYRKSILSMTVTGTVVCGSSMYYTFAYCDSLTSVDLSGFDTSSVTDMRYMFEDCDSLTSVDLSDLDTSSVTRMDDLFLNCSSLTSVDLSDLDTSSVTYMGFMFWGCESIKSLDLSSFDTSSVTWMSYMFEGCSSLATIYVSDLWSTASLLSGAGMFTDCTSLVGGNGTTYSSDCVDDTYARIDTASTPGYFTYKAYGASSSSGSSSSGSSGSSTSTASISGAKVKLSKTSYVYNGKARKPGVTVTLDGATLTKGTDYTVSYSNNKNAGTAKVTVKGTGSYTGTASATFKIKKASNPWNLSFKTGATVKYKKLKKSKLALKLIKITKAKGKVTCTRYSVMRNGKELKGKQLKKIVVNKRTGKITLKKGLAKGTYTVYVHVKAAGNGNYRASTFTAGVVIRVK